jgi:hypothetical protein
MLGEFVRTILMIGFFPPIIVIVVYLFVKGSLNIAAITQILTDSSFSLGVMLVITMTVMLLVTTVCLAVRPVEYFSDMDIADLQSFYGAKSFQQMGQILVSISNQTTKAEWRVCQLITRADKFTENEVGGKGLVSNKYGESSDTPEHKELVLNAQLATRQAVPSGLPDCAALTSPLKEIDAATVPGDISPDIVRALAEQCSIRLGKLEATLDKLTGPILQKAFDVSSKSRVSCEGFASRGHVPLQARINKIMSEIERQEQKLLFPIDAKVKRMQSGDLSDCEKEKGHDAGLHPESIKR